MLAIEVSNKSWVIAAQVPGLPHTKAKRTIDPEAEALLAAIAAYRARAAATGRRRCHQCGGRTHGCTDQACDVKISPCQLGAVHTWPKTSVRCLAAIRPELGVKPTCQDRSSDAIDPFGTSIQRTAR